MAKTQEELNKLKEDYENLNNRLKELSEEELIEVTGGNWLDVLKKIGEGIKQNANPVLKSSNTISSEETLGGKIVVTPTDNIE